MKNEHAGKTATPDNDLPIWNKIITFGVSNAK